ncbi:MAG: CinA family protein [Alphaproteobacteria bacterium]|nr:CinA family protein [Alphaproteobacteria bacterium]
MSQSIFPAELTARAAALLEHCKRHGVMLTSAESCTGGLIASLLTEIPGSSAAVERGFVTYSNEAKSEMLGVPAELIARVGAVSSEVACAMVEGALAHSRADIAVSVTGVAGPGGGSAEKPVGLVQFAVARRGENARPLEKRFGDRGRMAIRLLAVETALGLLEEAVSQSAGVQRGA